jgi:hypothetical protein
LKTLGRAGQQRIAQRFTFNQMIQEYAALYATLLPSRVDAEGQAQPGSNR